MNRSFPRTRLAVSPFGYLDPLDDFWLTHCGYAGIAGAAARVVYTGLDPDAAARLVGRDGGLA